jgi:hypothetical protein
MGAFLDGDNPSDARFVAAGVSEALAEIRRRGFSRLLGYDSEAEFVGLLARFAIPSPAAKEIQISAEEVLVALEGAGLLSSRAFQEIPAPADEVLVEMEDTGPLSSRPEKTQRLSSTSTDEPADEAQELANSLLVLDAELDALGVESHDRLRPIAVVADSWGNPPPELPEEMMEIAEAVRLAGNRAALIAVIDEDGWTRLLNKLRAHRLAAIAALDTREALDAAAAAKRLQDLERQLQFRPLWRDGATVDEVMEALYQVCGEEFGRVSSFYSLRTLLDEQRPLEHLIGDILSLGADDRNPSGFREGARLRADACAEEARRRKDELFAAAQDHLGETGVHQLERYFATIEDTVGYRAIRGLRTPWLEIMRLRIERLDPEDLPPPPAIPPPSRFFGVELEVALRAALHEHDRVDVAHSLLTHLGLPCYTGREPQGVRPWKVLTDASVRPADPVSAGHGLEIVTPPLHGQTGAADLARVCAGLRHLGVHEGHPTTGTHVTINAPELVGIRGVPHQVALLRSYAYNELAISSFLDVSRMDPMGYGGHPLSTMGREEHAVLGHFAAGTDRLQPDVPITGVLPRDRILGKRARVNLSGLVGPKRAVEFRQMEGTLDAERILMWAHAMSFLVDEAARRPDHVALLELGYDENGAPTSISPAGSFHVMSPSPPPRPTSQSAQERPSRAPRRRRRGA